ncbi:hypothetical protein [Streptomyces paradoxus]|uniref:hypothetical protein n=1 Tax=Streptomyces paradoxus TaxID=66375 RepID=UPI0037D1F4B9
MGIGDVCEFSRFRDNVAGDLTPRQVLFLVEWESEEAFNRFRDDPELADLHPLRESGTASYIWQTFDGSDMSDPTDLSRSTTSWRCSSLSLDPSRGSAGGVGGPFRVPERAAPVVSRLVPTTSNPAVTRASAVSFQ